MKNFIYKETKHHNRTQNNRELTIYQIKNNTPKYIGSLEYSTGSTRGAQHEAFNYLMGSGYIPKKYYNSSKCSWMGAGYFFGEVTKLYNIIEI
jgi:hypothetical protein